MTASRTLVLIRHAKSSWSDRSIADYDRPLNKRGKRDALFMGNRLLMKKLYPDLFAVSSANRAKSTAKRISSQIKFPKNELLLVPDLYLADQSEMYDFIRTVDEKVQTLFLVGHNYGITDFANSLAPDVFLENIPTAGIAAFSIGYSWAEIDNRCGTFLFFEFPKQFQTNT